MEKESRVPLSLWKALIMTSEQVTASIDELSVGNACFFELFYFGLNHTSSTRNFLRRVELSSDSPWRPWKARFSTCALWFLPYSVENQRRREVKGPADGLRGRWGPGSSVWLPAPGAAGKPMYVSLVPRTVVTRDGARSVQRHMRKQWS